MVRTYDGEPVGRVPADLAGRIVAEGQAETRRCGDRGYVRLLPGISIERNVRGWELIERARLHSGDNAVARGIRHMEMASETALRWIGPAPLRPLTADK
jgi:hypothetical protein